MIGSEESSVFVNGCNWWEGDIKVVVKDIGWVEPIHLDQNRN
jgi:hypothetical protein